MKTLNKKVSGGFSIVELMVGLTIGLITILVIMQVMGFAEARKRNSTSGADSVINAALGLYTIERNAKNAGYGMTTMNSTLGCPIKAQNGGTNYDFKLVPAEITDGVDGEPDKIRLLASSKNGITMPTKITVNHPSTAANFFVESDLGFEEGDLFIAVPISLSTATPPTNWCALGQVTKDGGGGGGNGNGNDNGNNGQGQGQNQVLHNSGSDGPWNQPGGQTVMASYSIGDYLINIGDLSDHTYYIEQNALMLKDFKTSTPATPDVRTLYPNIVQLQAVYGKDTNGDGVVDAWNATAPTDTAAWRQVRALRIALVARAQEIDPQVVTLDGNSASSPCASATPPPAAVCWRPDPTGNGVTINVSKNPDGTNNPNWQRYRYRVMETTIPLRNVIWQE